MSETLLQNANALLNSGRPREALPYYERYLGTNPQSAEAWHNRAAALAQVKRFSDAKSCYDRALAIAPTSAQTWNNRGNLLFEERHYEDAAADYGRALAINPEISYARGYRLLCKLWCCDWKDVEAEREAVLTALHLGKRVIQPFGSLMISRDPAELASAAAIWNEGRYGAPAPLWRGERYRHDKIRIAYVSGDFREHPVSYLIAGVLEHHDRDAFEICAVSFGPDDGGETRGRIARAVSRFEDARRMTDLEIASWMRNAEIDIAVDLMGLTADARGGIFAHRPAPVQVNYLGFPGTAASPHLDAIIADRMVIPGAKHIHYRERVVYLPDCYMAADDTRVIANLKPSRAAVGLPEDAFVFASFNSAYKFRPETFAIWMRLLCAVPESVLWLPEGNAAARANLKREASARGVAPERLVFAPYLDSQPDHLARLSLADLFLDTLPCNAHTTACDALWAGLPVLTCAGTTFPGRVAASLLTAVGLPELIARSLADYEAMALALARDKAALPALRARLAANRLREPLFDTARFTRNLEDAYRALLEPRP